MKRRKKKTHTWCIMCGAKKPIGGPCPNAVPEGTPTTPPQHPPQDETVPDIIKAYDRALRRK